MLVAMFGFLRNHVFSTLTAAIGGVIAVGGAARDLWEATTLGLQNEVWLAIGLVVFFVATLSLIYRLWQRLEANPAAVAVAEKAELRLLFRQGSDAPEKVASENVWRWYWLQNILVVHDTATGERREHAIPNLFVAFDKPVRVGSLHVRSPDFTLPRFEVKEFRERYAIVVFHDHLPGGVLELRTEP